MKLYKLLLSIIFLVIFGCSGPNSSVKITPQLNFTDNYSQTLVFETRTHANKMGSFNEKSDVKFALDSINSDGHYVMTGTIVRIQYSSDLFDEKESFDSDNLKSNGQLSPAEQDILDDLGGALNNPFQFTIDRYGNILKAATFKTGGGNPDLVSSYTCSPVIFPEEELYEGFEWETDSHNPILESQKIVTRYIVESITESKIILEVEMNIDEAAGGMVKAAKAVGTYELDRQTRRFLSGQREMKMQFGGGKATYKIYEKQG